nr:methyl-accepting chemotaxis protein [Pseudenhygromyxa sp. WMMC2535]
MVSETITSLVGAAEDISREAGGVLGDAEQTLAATDAMVEKIAELGAYAEGIGGLLEGIREIADRSDLLALNGALEATRAGEAGRGFALVAAEMRRLAERVTSMVADVHARVTNIQAASAGTTAVTERSRALAQSTAAAAREIRALIERQGVETEAVATNIHQVADTVRASAAANSQTRATAEGLKLQADTLERLTRASE